jgi:flagellar protein FliT
MSDRKQKQENKVAARSEVVHCYGQLASSISQMVVLARAKEWGRLPDLEAQCSAVVVRLKVIEPVESLDPAQLEQVLRLIDRIRVDQAEVSGLIKPQLDDLIGKMGYLHQQRVLGKAYGPPH